jgi:hypothetical protein
VFVGVNEDLRVHECGQAAGQNQDKYDGHNRELQLTPLELIEISSAHGYGTEQPSFLRHTGSSRATCFSYM